MPNGYIILKHQVFREISDEEVLETLPKEDKHPKYKIFDIKREIIGMESIHLLNNFEFRIYQKNIVENEIKPFLTEHPDYQVLYFGTSTIPLALHLGYCFGSWTDVQVFQLQRQKNAWDWFNDDQRNKLPTISTFIKEEFNGPINVIYNVEATYTTHEAELLEVVETPNKKISLCLENIEKDAFRNQAQLKAFANEFSLGLDSVANNLPNTEKIHLFPTVPVGLAFLMGAKINPNITKPIVTYQYNTNRSPRYEKILTLQEQTQVEVNITEEDQKFIDDIKASFKIELETKIAPFAKSKIQEKVRAASPLSWIKLLLPEGNYSEMQRGAWGAIPDQPLQILSSSTLSIKTDLAADGFHISEDNEWQINDRFIFNISDRLEKNKDAILRALRMFIFHEAFHIYQRLTNYTADNIGRFPRILEEADYMADVWAMVFEFSYSSLHNAADTGEVCRFFNQVIETAIKTMWAFDDLDPNNEEMQIRRLNRYLIWYWNYIQIEDRSCKTLEDIITILANKPLLELKGLDIRAQSQRTVFKLTNFTPGGLEIAYFNISGQILRASNAAGLQIDDLVRGFKERKGEIIMRQLKSFYHQQRKH